MDALIIQVSRQRLEFMDCPNCKQKEINLDWKRCPMCATTLAKRCPSCENMLESNWNICPYCASTPEKNEAKVGSSIKPVTQASPPWIRAVAWFNLLLPFVVAFVIISSVCKWRGKSGIWDMIDVIGTVWIGIFNLVLSPIVFSFGNRKENLIRLNLFPLLCGLSLLGLWIFLLFFFKL